MKKIYSNGEITIVWEPQKCIHSGYCVGSLPEVFKPAERPWMQMENATTQALITAVQKCPSGALVYYLNTI
ncbi:MAG: (4Fe-4S)-binding protein [Rikenellaceae bacterium]|nr:(4Fe-4S)-binding protein [Rikenellaceae bacterium]